MSDNSKMAAELWQKFLMLTQEMLKFIEKNDIDMFLNLLEQRLGLQKQIETLADDVYHKTTAGQAIISKINPLNEQIQILVQKWLNNSRQQQQRAKAYDSYGVSAFTQKFNRDY